MKPTTYGKLTVMNEDKDRFYFSNVDSLISKLLAIIININIRFTFPLYWYHLSWNA